MTVEEVSKNVKLWVWVGKQKDGSNDTSIEYIELCKIQVIIIFSWVLWECWE